MSRRSGATNGGTKETSVKPQDVAQDKQAKLLAGNETGHFSMIKALHLADLLTEGNGFCGFMSVLSSMHYLVSNNTTHLWIALGLMPFGLLFDLFDGKVARWRGKSSLMGQELDSLADLVSFGVAPAAAAFAMGFRSPLDQLVLTFYVLCGLTRLARFNVTVAMLPKDASGKSKYFEGTPIPFACLTTLTMEAIFLSGGWTHDKMPFGLLMEGTPFAVHTCTGLFLLMACLMVSKTLHVPKP